MLARAAGRIDRKEDFVAAADRTAASFGAGIGNAAARAAVIAVTVFGFAEYARAQLPSVNIQQTCRLAAAAMIQILGGSTAQNDYEICLNSEQQAREQLVKEWSTFSAADKAQCLQAQVYLPSYMEWQTCLEMERDVRKLRGNTPAPSASGPVTLPTVPPAVNEAKLMPGPTTPLTLPVVPSGINDARSTGGPMSPIRMPVVRPSVHY